jgi:phage repressor protein C with HTH and peptisase S24 domain
MYERGERLPGVDFLARFSEELEIPFEELLSERLLSSADPCARERAGQSAGGRGSPEYVPVQHVRSSATGEPRESAPPPVAFSRDWLRGELGLGAEQLGYLEMEGDAMEPTLRTGAQLLVDCTGSERTNWEGIYVLNMAGELLVKRLQRLPDHRIKVSSDNPAYEDFVLPVGEGEAEPDVMGQVVWVGRRV